LSGEKVGIELRYCDGYLRGFGSAFAKVNSSSTVRYKGLFQSEADKPGLLPDEKDLI
jgi:hypothetical protein